MGTASRRRSRFRATLALALVVGGGATLASPASGQATPRRLPDDPRELRFPPSRFAVPAAEPLRHTLPNGVPVYVVEDPTLPLVQVDLALRVGDYLDPPAQAGLASLTAALLRRGGAGRWSADDFDAEADRLAVDLSTVGASTRGGASLDCATRVLEPALDLFFAMVREPRFEAERVGRLLDNLRAGLARRNDQPLDLLDREWRWLLLGRDHYAARQTTPRELEAIGRDDLVAFHRAWWRPGRMVVAVSGDVRTAAILERLARGFAGWEAGPEPPWPPPAPSEQPRPGLYLVEAPLPQAKIALGHLGAQRRSWDDAEADALAVVDELLGGPGAAARLRRRLRAEEGLAYRVTSSLGVGTYGRGTFQVVLETAPRSAARAVALTIEEIERLRDEPVERTELDFVRRALVDRFPLLFDRPEEVAGRFAEDELLGRPHSYWHGWREAVGRVGAAELGRAARRHLHPEALVVVIVGPEAEIARGARESGLRLERLVAGGVTRLPRRDPLTLEVVSPLPSGRPGP